MLNRWNYHKGINFVSWKYKKPLEKSCFSELLDIQAPGVDDLTGILHFVCKKLEYYHLSILPTFCKMITGHSFICTACGLNSNIFIFCRKIWLWNRLEREKIETYSFSLSFPIIIKVLTEWMIYFSFHTCPSFVSFWQKCSVLYNLSWRSVMWLSHHLLSRDRR